MCELWQRSASERARAADHVVADCAPLGPLHGVPFTVKENIDVAVWSRSNRGCARHHHADRPALTAIEAA